MAKVKKSIKKVKEEPIVDIQINELKTFVPCEWVIQFDELPDHEAYLKMYANAVKLAEENKEEDE
jgi:hypothetical protein